MIILICVFLAMLCLCIAACLAIHWLRLGEEVQVKRNYYRSECEEVSERRRSVTSRLEGLEDISKPSPQSFAEKDHRQMLFNEAYGRLQDVDLRLRRAFECLSDYADLERSPTTASMHFMLDDVDRMADNIAKLYGQPKRRLGVMRGGKQ